ncbi:MAG: pyruvate kinase [Pseudomonadota bacterium]
MRDRLSKIVATVGPASASPSMLEQLNKFGVDVFRLNFSHGEQEAHGEVINALREVEARSGRPLAIFADLQGPKIRCGTLPDGAIELRFGEKVTISPEETSHDPSVIPVPHPDLLKVLEVGDILMLDDGKLQLEVLEKEIDQLDVKVTAGGILKDRKGVNIPTRQLPISALTTKDKQDLAFALEKSVDFIALSFVQRPDDILEARRLIDGRAGIIAKIEKPSAVEAIDDIIELSDAIMVARGDLGVEMPPEQVPVLQRRIIRACRAKGVPVIVATHMLETMVDSPTPTRAEASDVSTAIMQGADAVMLSAETAVGHHPLSAVAIMDRIIKASELEGEGGQALPELQGFSDLSTADSISRAASAITEADDVKALVAYTKTGSTAQRLSRERPPVGLLALTPDKTPARRLCLSWGIEPVISDDVGSFDEMHLNAQTAARQHTNAREGDRIVVVTGYPFGRPGKTNTINISRL